MARRPTTTTRSARKTTKRRMRVSYADAQRVRQVLQAEDVEMLSARDVRTLLNILNSVYPPRSRKPRSPWQPLLIGVGIGLLLVVGLTIL